jgi:hypothetical protein
MLQTFGMPPEVTELFKSDMDLGKQFFPNASVGNGAAFEVALKSKYLLMLGCAFR